ncbi:unnamed protein product [Mycena citricolor]|uniref:ATP-binding cassette transporter n=1 Tax=Mycena citricolor TaxID=2018698 RepID=A0AAD2GQY6_9AGAR|nr:unnamed protein product [Mycena citricolor]
MEVANLVLAVAMGLSIAIASINWANSIRQGRVRVEDWSRFEDSGYSLREEDVFLKRLEHRKYVVLGLLLANLVFEISGAQPTLAAVISIYMLLLVLFSAHETYVYHLSALTLVGSLISGRKLLLPTYTHRNWTHGLVFAMNALLCLISLTTPLSPPMTYGRTRRVAENATGSILNSALFLFTTEIFSLRHLPSFEIHDLPILPANIRTAWNLSAPHSGAHPIISQLLRVNLSSVTRVGLLSFGLAFVYYAPSFFLNRFLQYLEDDTSRSERGAAWIWVCGLGVAHFALALAMSQQQFVGHVLKIKLRLQLNTLLFSKTLLRQNVSAESSEDAVNSKADIIALMSSDVEQVVGLADAIYDIVDTPVEILVGIFFLYRLLGVSSLVGLVVVLICLPLHHVSGSVVAQTQRNLVHARDERIALTNEILGAIRMLKFMAWEIRFEEKVLRIRMKELAYQKLTYTIEMLWTAMGDSVPILFAITSFWHFTVIRGQDLTPAIAFTALSIFTEIQFAIKGIPAAIINIIKASVSLNRIQRYLDSPEVTSVVSGISASIELKAATIAWPKAVLSSDYEQFTLKNVTVSFPPGCLSLVCGKFGSGKSLLLLGLLGEANIVEGTVTCPRSHPNSLESLSGRIDPEGWVVPGVTAYVPQTAWLRNQSIKDNILFHLPLDEARYRATLHACALVADLQVLEDGDESEIGEHGVNLSGGQKARVSLARAVYSCASTLLLDDVLSAVDSHTAHHIYHHCLTGPLMQDRTVILVSHHVQLCAPGAALVVALQDGKVAFQGDADGFSRKMGIFDLSEHGRDNTEPDRASVATATTVVDDTDPSRRKPARKYVEEESRSHGVIDSDIWVTYMRAAGSYRYWMGLAVILFMGGASALLENGTWSASDATESRGAMFYVGVYAGLTLAGLAVKTFRWFMLYSGSIQASRTIFQDLLHSILNTTIHFHDTISRGRVLNRFGKDLEAIDKQVAVTVGHSVMALVSAMITFCVMTLIGGWVFFAVSLFLGAVYFHSSISSSPLHSVYWETVSGITTLRAFGASSQFMTNLIKILDNNTAPLYWTAAMGQWLGLRSNALTGVLTFAVAIMAVFSPRIDAGLTGFMILFATQVTNDAMRYSGLEQDLVSLERIKEYSELTPEVSSDCELIPPPKWPQQGSIRCENLVVRYRPESPPVLHGLNFDIKPGEKIGIVGRTGSGKSTLALSLFRFIPHFEGTIFVDGLDISKIGLTELRRSLTIIPQDPTILSGTLRSTLDVFGEHTDSEIFDALRRVHLISNQDSEPEMGGEQINVFRNLDSPVSEGGDNLSLGEKQLICMARAVLKHSRILIMDEATASHRAFKASTVLTIAHRLSTILTYDRIMVLDSGQIVEFDRQVVSPAALLADSTTRFHAMYKATGGRKPGV